MTSVVVCPNDLPCAVPEDAVVLVVSEDAKAAVDAVCATVSPDPATGAVKAGVFVGSQDGARVMAAEMYDYK